jgi:DNA-binding Xre family transcriptional regulator
MIGLVLYNNTFCKELSMAQILALLSSLKQTLRAQGHTYAEVATWLNISEASVKRMFAQSQMSLERLEKICHAIGIEISDLVHIMEKSQASTVQLTQQQEREIVEDLVLIVVMVCAFNYWKLQDIIHHFALDEATCIKKLLKLEKMGLLDLMPNNRIKLRIDKRFKWHDNGPFEQFFRHHVGKEFFRDAFHVQQRCLRVFNATLPQHIIMQLQGKFDALMAEVMALNREYADQPVTEKEGITVVLVPCVIGIMVCSAI